MGTDTKDKSGDKPKPDVKRAESDRKKREAGKTFTRPGAEKRG